MSTPPKEPAKQPSNDYDSAGSGGYEGQGWIDMITSVGSLILSGYGLYKQDQDNQAVREESAAEMRRIEKKEDQRYNTQLALTREQIKRDETEKRRAWAWKEEDRNWQRATEFANGIRAMVSQTPGLGERLTRIWPGRGAA